MKVFLLRHFESEKNVNDRLSGTDNEGLTEYGRQECKLFSECLKKCCDQNDVKFTRINSANSKRAQETSKIIGKAFHISNINYYEELRSTNAGRIAGKSVREIQEEDPFFSKHYELYRKGVLDLYYFDNNWKDELKESKKNFENRVIQCFESIIKEYDMSREILLIAHRASITAILIYIARKIGVYPENFYGNVESSIGGLSCVSLNEGQWDIEFVNKTKEEIENAFNSIYNQSR